MTGNRSKLSIEQAVPEEDFKNLTEHERRLRAVPAQPHQWGAASFSEPLVNGPTMVNHG